MLREREKELEGVKTVDSSLIPRTHPLTRKKWSGETSEILVGIAHTPVTVSPSNIQNFTPNLLKEGMDTQVEIKSCNARRGVLP